MKKNYLIVFFTILLFNQFSFAQSINNWQIKNDSESSRTISKSDRKSIPNNYKVFSLDFKSLKINFKSASKRESNNKLATTLLLDFPLENGSMESFTIEKTSVLHPDLEAKYPEIQSFYGVSKKNPLNKIYISMSPEGFTGVITGEKTIYIDPYSKKNVNDYIVYDRKDYERNANDSFVCHTDMDNEITKSTSNTAKSNNAVDAKLRTYDLAVACTSEYTAYYGNTVAGALAAINTTITRVNSVYRRDLGIQFQIVANNDRLIYKDNFNKDSTPDPDPYENYDGGQMLGVNSGNIDGLLGTNSYDIGHVFSTGGGGIAGLSPCTTTSGTTAGKGRGVTGIVTPQYDPFDIDYVCHEIGHQFGAGHTQNNPCQIATTSAMEPGSGSTIMGYAGICPPNIQNNSDAYFHAISIQQITATMLSNTCESEAIITNNEPVITAVPDYTIPKSTPFILTGIASDPGDTMTYCWEQMNNGTSSGTMPPISTSTNRPTFRSFSPTIDPSRTFPNLNAIISNTTPTWEVLPSVARALNFRLTVRDNNSLGGQSNQDNIIVNINATVGPFAVTAPNTSATWYVGESKTITWDVLGTNTATYALNVNIKLSTDGGLTYPITLLANTPNDGTQAITVPNNIGKTNRIKVEAVANIFFDISNANFEIKSNKFDLTTSQSSVSVCKPANAVYTINYTPAPGFNESVTFSAVGLPSGATAVFSPTTTTNAGSVTMTISNNSTVAVGNHNFNFNGTSTTANINLPLTLKISDNNIGNITLTSPVNGAENQQTSVLLQWNNLVNASSYTVEIASNPNFSTLIETATVTGNSYQTTSLTTGTINYWRVKPINPCLTGAYSETFSFQIASDFCKTYTDKYFEGNADWEPNSTNAVIAKMDITDNIVISKASFYMKATHALLSDIKMQFSGPTGIFVEVYNRDCTGANFDVTFDDNGTPLACGDVDPLTAAALEGVQQASQPLAKYNGSSSLGTWTLLATDRVSNTSGGKLTDFKVIICGKLQIVNNISTVNNTINLPINATNTVLQSKLEATQPTATASQLVYTITQLPINGVLKLNNVAIVVGGTFTQADINNSLVSYTHNGVNTNADSFKYSINGINSAFLGGQTFNITICTPVTPTFTSVPAICSGATLSALPTTSLNGITGSWLPALNNTATTIYTFTPTAEQCVTTTTLTITVDPTTIGGSINGGTTVCSGSKSGTLTLSGYNGTILNWESSLSPFTTWTNIPNTTHTYISDILNETTQFRAILKSGSCTTISSTPTTVSIITTTWNGSSWDNGLPNSATSVILAGNYTATANLTACSLTVNNNAVVKVNPGFNFNIAGDVSVASGASLTFESNANLVQTKNTNGNTGNITVKRKTSALMLLDYVLWSAPVSSQQLQLFSPSTLSNRFYTYNPSTNFYNGIASTTNFATGTGYLIRMPNNHPTTPTIWEGQFQGIPNNGNYNLTVTNNTYNAIGNPYPSTINANTFISTNNITEALYFWRKTNNTLSSSYATYTLAGGTANAGGLSSIIPNGIIQVGQGFIAKATSNTISFTNEMRLGNNGNQFLRTKNIERNRIWLNLSTPTSPVNQMLIAYMTDATAGIDATIDGKYINDNPIALNSLIENEEFIIQGRSLPFVDTDIVHLTFKTNVSGNYSIAIDHVDGLFANQQDIFLMDKLNGSIHDLKKSEYPFSSAIGTFNNRFELMYKNSKTLGIETPIFDENTILVFNQQGVININSGSAVMKNVTIFDIRGRIIFEQKEVNANKTSIQDFGAAEQTLIIKITSDKNEVVTKKVVY
ncbi:reprolysin-like metallopeptidase [Flavobacterium sp. LS2R12]|uniref:reprolysin-like metallopeptidase n=1 Tax=unclassified Flavobacterium TaxID=196869 RepID=UPI003AB04150